MNLIGKVHLGGRYRGHPASEGKVSSVPDLRSKLSNLVPGDIIHGRCASGPSLICLVESVETDRIEARRITTQCHVTFDIETGEDIDNSNCRLDSIAPLPVDVHNVLLGLDRKMRLGKPPLSQAEKEALRFVADFCPAHPLQPPLSSRA